MKTETIEWKKTSEILPEANAVCLGIFELSSGNSIGTCWYCDEDCEWEGADGMTPIWWCFEPKGPQ